jgi:glycosyltransferase involved in cell wall biosynthesis
MLAARKVIQLKVFYTWGESVLKDKYDPGFGKSISWDIPLLEGYEYSFVENISKDPGSHHFKGIDNPGLIREIEDWKADAVLIYGWPFKSHLKAMRYFHRKIPVFFRGDSTILNKKNSLRSLIRKYFLRWVYSYIDKAFYVGTNNKHYFLQHGLKENALIFAPHAIDNERFADDTGKYQQQADEWRNKLSINRGDLVIVYAGKLEPIKNLAWLIETIKESDVPTLKLLMVGNGPLEKELKQKASSDTGIIFMDFQNQQHMPVVYRLGQVFILCSHSETWGLSVNEAMASGRAILVNQNCGCGTDLVKDGSNGFVFNSFDKLSLVKCIKKLVADQTLVKNMGGQSKQIIDRWNFEEVCKAIESALV